MGTRTISLKMSVTMSLIVAATAPLYDPTPGRTAPHVAVAATPSEHWLAFLSQVKAPTSLQVVITSAAPTSGTVSGAPLPEDIPFTITDPTIPTVIDLPTSVVSPPDSGRHAKGIRVQALHPVTVYGISSGNADMTAFLALPLDQLGTRYRVLTAPDADAVFGVIATTDATTVTVGATAPVTLQAGEFSVLRATTNVELSGTLITADHPVAVMAGHRCSLFVNTACSAIAEQLPPVSAWGTDHVVARLPRRDDGGNPGEAFRVVADTADTEVYVDGVLKATLAAGAMWQSYLFPGLSVANPLVGGRITTSAPALVGMFTSGGRHLGVVGDLTGGASFSVVAPTTALPRRIVVTPMVAGLDDYGVTLALPSDATASVKRNGVLVDPELFAPLGATGWSAAHISLTAGAQVITADETMAAFWWGVGLQAGYGAIAAWPPATEPDPEPEPEPDPEPDPEPEPDPRPRPQVLTAPPVVNPPVEVFTTEGDILTQVRATLRSTNPPPHWRVAAWGHQMHLHHHAVSSTTSVRVCIGLDPRLQLARPRPDRLRLLHHTSNLTSNHAVSMDITDDRVRRPGWVCGVTQGLGTFQTVALAAHRLGGPTRIETAQLVAQHLHGPRATRAPIRVHPFDEPAMVCFAVLAHQRNRPLVLDPSVPRHRLPTCRRHLGFAPGPVDLTHVLDLRTATHHDVDAVAAHQGSPVDAALALLIAMHEGRPLLLLDPATPTPGRPAMIVGGLARLPTSVER